MSSTRSGNDGDTSMAQRLQRLAPERRRLLSSLLAQHAAAQVPGTARLVACYVASAGRQPASSELSAHLAGRLPDYMVPRQFVAVAALPRLANGKLDRRAATDLAGLLDADVASQGAAPSSPAETVLAQIWCAVLGIDEVSVDDNFFELGGDSLLSIRILSRAQAQGLTLSPDQFFDNPTIAGQAAAAAASDTDTVGAAADEPLIDLDDAQLSNIAELLDGLEREPGA